MCITILDEISHRFYINLNITTADIKVIYTIVIVHCLL
jgi:hypothetical protein